MRPIALPLLASLLFAAAPLRAFTVARDAGLPPVEKTVLFDKSAPSDRLAFFAKGKSAFARAPDGALLLRIDHNEPVEAGFSWTAGPGAPPAFSVSEYRYILVTCRLEGADRQTFANGKVSSRRADNLWCAFALFDENRRDVARAGLAEAAPGGKTPERTVTLRLPMILFTYWGENPRPPVHGFGFQWNGTRPAPVRDYTLVIERVALAD